MVVIRAVLLSSVLLLGCTAFVKVSELVSSFCKSNVGSQRCLKGQAGLCIPDFFEILRACLRNFTG